MQRIANLNKQRISRFKEIVVVINVTNNIENKRWVAISTYDSLVSRSVSTPLY